MLCATGLTSGSSRAYPADSKSERLTSAGKVSAGKTVDSADAEECADSSGRSERYADATAGQNAVSADPPATAQTELFLLSDRHLVPGS